MEKDLMQKNQSNENRNTAPDPSGGKPDSNVPGKNSKEEPAEGTIRKVQSKEERTEAYGDDVESATGVSGEDTRIEKDGSAEKS